jgi:hypothetical protein
VAFLDDLLREFVAEVGLACGIANDSVEGELL